MKKVLVLSLVIVLSACASQVQKGAITLAYSNFEDRDYEDTLIYINQAENAKETSAELKAELTYLKARTYEKMGKYSDAKALYGYLVEQHPQSQYSYLAKEKLENRL